ncbi:MAG: hypothetical protein QW328_09065 [Nitrososphaerota archaeon]
MSKKLKSLISRDPKEITISELMKAKNEIIFLLILEKLGVTEVTNEDRSSCSH